jgi:hypothetical protein
MKEMLLDNTFEDLCVNPYDDSFVETKRTVEII